MDSDLLTEAQALAGRGWLPGITNRHHFKTHLWHERDGRYATEADVHLAAHREIVRREAGYRIADNVTMFFPTLYRDIVEPGTTTLSLLRCLRRACEAQENNNGQ